MPRKVFVAGEILTAADVNTNLMDQAVMVFAGTAARGSDIPTPVEGMVSYLNDADRLELYTTAWKPVNTGFTAGTTITATNASFSVPALGAPIVRVTVIGGGGGGGGGSAGGAGGATTFNAGGGGTVTAAGGVAGASNAVNPSSIPTAGFSSNNGGNIPPNNSTNANPGSGGQIVVSYLNLTGISTVNVTVGAGGSGGSDSSQAGGRGEVIFEYVAA
jgi:hypothetical protein